MRLTDKQRKAVFAKSYYFRKLSVNPTTSPTKANTFLRSRHLHSAAELREKLRFQELSREEKIQATRAWSQARQIKNKQALAKWLSKNHNLLRRLRTTIAITTTTGLLITAAAGGLPVIASLKHPNHQEIRVIKATRR